MILPIYRVAYLRFILWHQFKAYVKRRFLQSHKTTTKSTCLNGTKFNQTFFRFHNLFSKYLCLYGLVTHYLKRDFLKYIIQGCRKIKRRLKVFFINSHPPKSWVWSLPLHLSILCAWCWCDDKHNYVIMKVILIFVVVICGDDPHCNRNPTLPPVGWRCKQQYVQHNNHTLVHYRRSLWRQTVQ